MKYKHVPERFFPMSLEEPCEEVRISEKESAEIFILKIFQMLQTSDLTVFGDCRQRTESNRIHGKDDLSVLNRVWNCRFPERNQFADSVEILESISKSSRILCEP
jgi:hypothetical protein